MIHTLTRISYGWNTVWSPGRRRLSFLNPAALIAAVGVIATALALAPGRAGGTAPETLCDAAPLIAPGLSLGSLSLGMQAAAAHQLLDAPGTLVEVTQDRLGQDHVVFFKGPSAGWMYVARNGLVVMLVLVDDGSYTQKACSTAEGLHLGSTPEEVQAAYGPPPRIFQAASGGSFWIYDQRGIAFDVRPFHGDTTVSLIEVFRAGEYCQVTITACQ